LNRRLFRENAEPRARLGGASLAGCLCETMNNTIQTNSFVPNTNRMNTHAIRWKSTVSGSIGTGTKLFAKEEAERLAAELNEEYPEIDHEAVIPVLPSATPAVVEAVNG